MAASNRLRQLVAICWKHELICRNVAVSCSKSRGRGPRGASDAVGAKGGARHFYIEIRRNGAKT